MIRNWAATSPRSRTAVELESTATAVAPTPRRLLEVPARPDRAGRTAGKKEDRLGRPNIQYSPHRASMRKKGPRVIPKAATLPQL